MYTVNTRPGNQSDDKLNHPPHIFPLLPRAKERQTQMSDEKQAMRSARFNVSFSCLRLSHVN
jgi:hypothetical protein